MSSILNEEAEKNPQFKAVRQWNSIVRKFCREVPRKRHMKSFRSYESSFTGREAVDLLLVVLPGLVVDGNVVTREKCVLLLEKFLQGDIIRSVRDLSAGFDDSSELYVLSPASEEISREEPSRPLRTPRRRNTAVRVKVRKSYLKSHKKRPEGAMPSPSSLYVRREQIFLEIKTSKHFVDCTHRFSV